MNAFTAYPKLSSNDVRLAGKRIQDGLEGQVLVIQTPFGYRRTAELFAAQEGHARAAILYVHWYEPQSTDSNRSQFVREARELARCGAVCLLVETMWSDPDFFLKRTQVEDFQNSLEEVVNLRRAIDLLLSQPDVDSKRIAYVGHDFGGMYGVLAGSFDGRPTHYVIMAATPRFPDWYLYAPKLDGEARETFIRQFAPIDPITHIAQLSPAHVLFQFGTDDPHVPRQRAEEFFSAAQGPKDVRWYEAGHGLNPTATSERIRWLKEQLRLQG